MTNKSATIMRKTIGLIVCLLCASCMMAALPSVELKNTDGVTVHTDAIAGHGKPVIIAFFATWCKPCMRELKAIHELYADWQDETGVEMYIVSIDQGQDCMKVEPLVNGYGWDYHVLLDSNGAFKRAMNVQNIPHLFVLNGKGEIVYNHTGYTDGSETDIRRYLE